MRRVGHLLENQYAANLLALQGITRVSGLMGIGALSAVRKTLDLYLLYLQHSADYVKDAKLSDRPEKAVSSYADVMSECVEQSWQNYRNHLQIWLLTQDEALIWVAKIDKALLNAWQPPIKDCGFSQASRVM